MKNIFKFLILSSFIYLSNINATMTSSNSIQDLAAAEKYFQEELEFTTNPYGVKMAIEGKKGKIKIIDVRSRAVFAKGHIPGAINIPFDEFDHLEDVKNSEHKPIKDGYNYVYCYENLCNLAQKACVKLAQLGYPVKEMKGGFTDWANHQYPIEK